MNEKFYISFLAKFFIENLQNEIHLEKVLNSDNAIEYLNDDTFVKHQDTFDYYKGKLPMLITNDKSLNLKYRNVFGENEFVDFCLKNYSNYGLTEIDGKDILKYFIGIKENRFKEAYKYTYSENIIDEHNGQEYETDDVGWETNDWVDIDDEMVTPL